MKIKDILVIATEFNEDLVDKSGDVFYTELLEPRFKKAVDGKYILKVDMDDVFGFSSSFISKSFGELSKKYGKEEVLRHLNFKSDKLSIRINKVLLEIEESV